MLEGSRLGPLFVMAALASTLGAIPLLVLEIELPELQIVALRVWLGAGLLLALTRRNPFSLPQGLLGRTVALGVLLASHWFTFFYAITHASIAVALVLVFLAPVLAASGAARLFGEALTTRISLALATSLVGTILVVAGTVAVDLVGVAAGLASAVTLAAMILVGKPVAEAIGGLATATAQMSTAAIVLTPWMLAAVAEVPWEPRATRSALDFVVPIGILGFALTGLGTLVNWWVIARLPVATVGVLSYLEPATAVVWAAVVLDQRPALLTWIGVGVVIAGGVFVAAQSGRAGRDIYLAAS